MTPYSRRNLWVDPIYLSLSDTNYFRCQIPPWQMMVGCKETYIFNFFFCFVFLLCVCTYVRAMTCPPCDRIHCSPKSASKLECRGGTTTGVCGCCPACARVQGEQCGGYYNYLGKCDKGLYCEPVSKKKKGRVHKSREPEGICKKGETHFYYPD